MKNKGRKTKGTLPLFMLSYAKITQFHELAFAEWNKLDNSVREPLKKKLAERLEAPRVPATGLSGMPDCYKIKLLSAGYRFVYRVEDDIVFVTVIVVGKRDKLKVYDTAKSRL